MAVVQPSAVGGVPAAAIAAPERRWRDLLRQVMGRPSAAAAVVVVLLLVAAALLAPVLTPYDPTHIDVFARLQGPSIRHWLGTDSLGRDNLTRTLYGTRVALVIAVPSVVGAFVVGGVLGLLGGYLGGWLDRVLVVVFDALVSFPSVILGLALLTLLGPSVASVILVIATALVPYYGRLVRAQTLAEREVGYARTERALGASRTRVLLRHLVPNVVPTLLTVVAMDVPGAVVDAAGLAFLGLGVQAPTPDWGVMLNDGFTNIAGSPWGVVGPILALVVMTSAFLVLGESVRAVLDPRGPAPRRSRQWTFRKASR
ncbi:ABC transporter permease [Nocardioides mangrovicus]|uniref:ABC transporter permease n=1 Tax=Nocardioides mangrovicus TaxID=2478913 RepID=A0A3L8P0V1_9ACTN|nr:ABC transporter permease [Nocardioides mangrovicus]RLV49070.1 ABC transporter permease [Nocardioides mangrovicus]